MEWSTQQSALALTNHKCEIFSMGIQHLSKYYSSPISQSNIIVYKPPHTCLPVHQGEKCETMSCLICNYIHSKNS